MNFFWFTLRPSNSLLLTLVALTTISILLSALGAGSIVAIPTGHCFVALAWVLAWSALVNDPLKVCVARALETHNFDRHLTSVRRSTHTQFTSGQPCTEGETKLKVAGPIQVTLSASGATACASGSLNLNLPVSVDHKQ